MAAADSVPGVSGGTVAFILGFYEKFIFSLDHLLTGTKQERKEAICFLAKLGVGWVIGFVICVLLLGKVFDTHIYELCSLFLGFSVFAIPLIVLEEKECFCSNYKDSIFALLGIVIVVAITLVHPSTTSGLNLGHIQILQLLYIFVAGMIAISAMILPGISGSTLLLIMGLYVPIMNSIRAFLHLDLTVLPVLIAFGLGIVVGVVSVIRLVKKGLEHHRSKVLYLILGLISGSLVAIINGPTTLDTPQKAMGLSEFRLFFFTLGGVILAGMQYLKNHSVKK